MTSAMAATSQADPLFLFWHAGSLAACLPSCGLTYRCVARELQTATAAVDLKDERADKDHDPRRDD